MCIYYIYIYIHIYIYNELALDMCAQMTNFVNKNQRRRCTYIGSVYICMCVCTHVCVNIYI